MDPSVFLIDPHYWSFDHLRSVPLMCDREFYSDFQMIICHIHLFVPPSAFLLLFFHHEKHAYCAVEWKCVGGERHSLTSYTWMQTENENERASHPLSFIMKNVNERDRQSIDNSNKRIKNSIIIINVVSFISTWR